MSEVSLPPLNPPDTETKFSPQSLARLRRLTAKEMRETLCDRRTILTLVLMPLLLYPLMAVGFRTYILTNYADDLPVEYRIGFESREEHDWFWRYADLSRYTSESQNAPEAESSQKSSDSDNNAGQNRVRLLPQLFDNLEEEVGKHTIHLGVRLPGIATAFRQDGNLELDCEFILDVNSSTSFEAYKFLQTRLTEANARYLELRLNSLGIPQRATPVQSQKVMVGTKRDTQAVSLLSVVPLVLLLMTITGAVYPAIDLTAGERERGTLEILIAAPVPRLSLLLAKYFAVLSVAVLTATVNLLTMSLTLYTVGLGEVLLGQTGFSWLLMVQVFLLMLLFATFFSAVLLTITSFARSFKEAQAYLVPLMLISLVPGVISILPGVVLEGPMTITPLLNIVLLGRDVLLREANLLTSIVVVTSTMLYAIAAIMTAARIFGAEGVLYNENAGWSDLFYRPIRSVTAASAGSAMMCLVIIFPAYYFTTGLVGHLASLSIGQRLAVAGVATGLIFGLIPLGSAIWNRVSLAPGFQLRLTTPLAFLGGIFFGLSLWTLEHEAVVVFMDLQWATISPEKLAQAMEMVKQWRDLPVVVIVLTMAIIPGIFEELFFRGYLLNSLLRRYGPLPSILASATLFGFFHLVTSDSLAVERLFPSTTLGLVLGWVCWRTGSVLPSMLLHATHNALLVTLAYYQEQLSDHHWLVEEQDHLPLTWILYSIAGIVVASLLVRFSTPSNAGQPSASVELAQ